MRERPHPRRRDDRAAAPIEMREFPTARSSRRRRAAAHRVPRCAAPTCTSGTAVSPACRIRSSPATCRPARSTRCAAELTGIDGSTLREGDRVVFFDVHRTCGRCRACTVHRTPTRCSSRRVYGITDSADEGLFGGWAQAIYLEPGVGIARLPDAVELRRLHRRRLRPAHGGPHHRARGAAARRRRGRAGRRRRRAQRDRARAARRRLDHHRDRRAGARLELAREMGADHVLDLDATTPEERLASRARADARRGRRRRRSKPPAPPRAVEEGLDSRPRRRPLRHRRPLHGRRRQHDQRAPADQPQAPRDSRLLGQRGAALPARALVPRAPRRERPVARDRRAHLRSRPV